MGCSLLGVFEFRLGLCNFRSIPFRNPRNRSTCFGRYGIWLRNRAGIGERCGISCLLRSRKAPVRDTHLASSVRGICSIAGRAAGNGCRTAAAARKRAYLLGASDYDRFFLWSLREQESLRRTHGDASAVRAFWRSRFFDFGREASSVRLLLDGDDRQRLPLWLPNQDSDSYP